ncbi:MAG: SgcJ/EcaC family oxidoreductase [Pseudomonadota bacterium]
MSDDEIAIRALVATWIDASRRGDMATVLRLMSEDALFLQPGQAPMRGREQFAQAMPEGMQADAHSVVEEVVVAGELAYCRTQLELLITPAQGATMRRSGHTLSILRKQGGRWLLTRDANLLGPPQAIDPPPAPAQS